MSLFSSIRPLMIFSLALLGSCTFEKEKKEEIVLETEVSLEEEHRQLLAIGLQQIPRWGSFWKKIDAGFDPTAFRMSREISYESLEWPEENYIQPGSPFYQYLIPHPEGDGVVDIYSYKVVIPEEDKVSFNPDSEVIYFKSNGMRERLLFMGPSGGFEEAVWISPELLMVSGFFEDEVGTTPKIWLINPEEQVYFEYIHPFHTTQYQKTKYLEEKLDNIDF
ncbi:bifunctional isocitrate dehydrogenase kinase/phosphatase [Aquiflexum lacus]|uniref:bifunctional isocitrate dehydrogenase kinase/phosphatase n=1 Tax=Aquiflexum lacus TaxID=2483805 RepID=UPI001E38C0FB|nr:bifunctional isocitrate dehydrogenase kinase/phosphatase [Aquiflexum lacus]